MGLKHTHTLKREPRLEEGGGGCCLGVETTSTMVVGSKVALWPTTLKSLAVVLKNFNFFFRRTVVLVAGSLAMIERRKDPRRMRVFV
jgi:hypothetical protein